MLIIDPYSTSYGKLINKDKISKELTKYLITTRNGNFNYEYQNIEENDIVYILGFDQNEQDLPMFTHPIVFKDMKEREHIGIDLRKYVKFIGEQPLNIEEVYKDSAGCKFLITSSIVISDFLAEHLEEYRKIFKSVTSAYAVLVSNIVDMVIKLNPLEKYDLEIAIAYYANLLLVSTKNIEEFRDSIIARLNNTKFSLPNNKKHIETIVINLEKIITEYSIVGLINVIKAILPEEKAELINESIFVNMLSNLWFGPGNNETIIMALECMPLWIALVYSCVDDVTFKRSKLSTIFDKYSKNIDSKELVKTMELIIKSRRLQ